MGESGNESPSEAKLYECSVLIGNVPITASVIKRSCRITPGRVGSRSTKFHSIHMSVPPPPRSTS